MSHKSRIKTHTNQDINIVKEIVGKRITPTLQRTKHLSIERAKIVKVPHAHKPSKVVLGSLLSDSSKSDKDSSDSSNENAIMPWGRVKYNFTPRYTKENSILPSIKRSNCMTPLFNSLKYKP